MKVLSELSVSQPGGKAVVQLIKGDLSAIPEEHKADILVLSAYPGSYEPVAGTLIAALYYKGLVVKDLFETKEADLREQLNCWLSKPLSKELQEKLNFKRVICFEPGKKISEAHQVVGNIFRCINTFAFDEKNNVIAIPMVASGNQRAKMDEMLPALLEAALFWLVNGLPLKCIKLVVYREAQVEMALNIFNSYAKQEAVTLTVDNYKPGSHGVSRENDDISLSPSAVNESFSESTVPTSIGDVAAAYTKSFAPPPEQISSPPAGPATGITGTSTIPINETGHFDYFISYAHSHSDLVNTFVEGIKAKKNELQIFYDRDSIPPGGLWIKQLSAAIQKANKVLIFLSPDYDKSMVCWDEFQCAKLMEYNRREQIIQTIYLYDYKEIQMPPIMGIYSYIDCREGDLNKLTACIEKLLQ